jgi:NQR2/RnfD/RnfE family subunit of NADH-ubiquinone oxidoreductase
MVGLLRWLRSPKGNLTVFLCLLVTLAAPVAGIGWIAVQLAVAVVVSIGIDLAVSVVRRGALSMPDGALITGLMVGMILVPAAPLPAVLTATALAAGSRHALRTSQSNLFNPAAFGLLAALLLVPAGQSWWGALADLPAPFILVLLIGGSVIAWRVRKLPMVLAYFGAYFAAFTLAALVVNGPSASLAAVFRPPFLNAALFFGCLMLTDPATSPNRVEEQLVFAAGAAMVSAAAFVTIHGLHYLFIGLLVANTCWAWRRATARPAGQVATSAWVG